MMSISREKWVEFKQAGLLFEDWQNYNTLGLHIDNLIYLKNINLLDSLSNSLVNGILEWEMMGISRHEYSFY